ncbi:21085_t:CDS:2 [Rhizophagus irregularis]|nr:21085_t:CDS:2 [Rhizophagus irregularis]
MLPSFSKRSGAPLTDNEKLMIINAHNYLSKVNFPEESHPKSTLRKRVAEALGVAESTVGCVVADWNKRNDGTFTPHKTLGRPKFQTDDDVSELLRTKILNSNKTAEQVSTPVLCQFLSENGYTFSKWKLLWVLHHLGYYYGQGERRNILHESPNNVAFRCRYLRFRFANLEGQNDVPHRPEVFLDESYCHLHHISRNTWVPHQGVVLSPGHGNRGRKRSNAEEWNDVPNVVKDANIVPNQMDYHGNFNAEIFEDLFSTLCETLHEKYGPVNIHMDGASYHKRRVENIPTSSTKKQEIVEWLTAHNISFSNELRKPELLELVQMHKEKISFTCVEIAKQYGHEAVVKGEVARSGPHPNLLSIRNTLLDAFKNKINSKVILGLWRKTLKNAKAYFEADENANLIGEESDDYSDTDDDV